MDDSFRNTLVDKMRDDFNLVDVLEQLDALELVPDSQGCLGIFDRKTTFGRVVEVGLEGMLVCATVKMDGQIEKSAFGPSLPELRRPY